MENWLLTLKIKRKGDQLVQNGEISVIPGNLNINGFPNYLFDF